MPGVPRWPISTGAGRGLVPVATGDAKGGGWTVRATDQPLPLLCRSSQLRPLRKTARSVAMTEGGGGGGVMNLADDTD